MIPNEELDTGIRLCAENVSRLLRDAELLLENNSYGHAIALSVLAMEEYAKKLILLAAKLNPGKFDNEVRDAFISHNLKLQLAVWMLMQSYPDVPVGEELMQIVTDMAGKLDSLKLASLYVDYDGSLGWFDPNKQDYRDTARVQIAYAKELVKRVDSWTSKLLQS